MAATVSSLTIHISTYINLVITVRVPSRPLPPFASEFDHRNAQISEHIYRQWWLGHLPPHPLPFLLSTRLEPMF